MIKEYYANQTIETTISVEDAKIKAVKAKNITRKAVRVFDPDKKLLALAGGVGEIKDADLEAQAIDLLSLNMTYDYELTSDTKAHYTKKISSITDYAGLEKFTNQTLADLADISKNYVLTGDFRIVTFKNTLKNTLNLDLSNEMQYVGGSLTMKQKGSGNIMDAYTGIYGFDITKNRYADFLKDTEFIAKAYMTEPVSLESKDYKVLFQKNDLIGKFYSDILATSYETKTSLLADRLGEKIFNENINIDECYDNEDYMEFSNYDDEGIIRTADLPIVENGILKTILYDKKQAAKYGKKTTGSGFRGYNTHPNPSPRTLIFKNVKDNASQVIANDLIILPIISSGGDFLPNGNYSLPIQLALVFKNGNFIGKAPQLTITGNYLESFGKDFICIAKNDIMPELLSKTMVFTNAKVSVN